MARKQKSDAPPPASPDYTVLARRYRPQQFAELVGQEPAARALINALKSNRVAHAYLFTGARGVGKTSMARILAKALNCVNGPTPTPCDACDMCKSIASGEDVDVLEIDGASNRGIDEVREVRSNVQYRPSRARYKIYIIDEVHMLTPQAFNALLKTLEEPPPHVKFIFATTEAQKIPITILSRCQRFDFAGIGTPQIVEQLRHVVKREGMEADDEALELIARRAAGSMRDSQSLLDQLLAFGGDRLTVEQVHQLLGTAQDDRVVELASAVIARDSSKALELLASAASQGLQLGELLDQLIAYWRDLMVLNCSSGSATDLSVSSRHKDTVARQASAISLDSILAGLDILNSTKMRLRGSGHTRVLLEMAVIRLSRLDNLVALAQLARWLGQSAEAGSPPRIQGNPTAPAVPRPVQPPEGAKKKPVPTNVEPPAVAPILNELSLPQVWQEILAQLGGFVGNNLSRAELPAISGPNSLVIRFPAGYNGESEYCQKPGAFEKILKTVRGILGEAWNVRIQASPGGETTPPAPVLVAVTAESSLSRNRRSREAAEKDPLVRKVMEALGAEITRIDDGFAADFSPATAERANGAADGEEM